MAEIRIIEVPSELGAGTRGAHEGIEALKGQDQELGGGLISSDSNVRLEVNNALAHEETPTPNGKHIEGIVPVYEQLIGEISNLGDSEFLLVLAGDHSTAGGTISGLKHRYPESRIGVIWVDAHADLHSPFTTPSGNVHGMPLAAMIGEDNLECAINQPSVETVGHWESMKSKSSGSPNLRPEDICFVGVRSTEQPEQALMEKHRMRNFTVAEVRGKGADAVAIEVLRQLDQCDCIYVSFDVDSLDPTISRGTGTPVEDGLLVKETTALLKRLVADPRTKAFEIVEVNPSLDTQNPMAVPAYEILSQVITTIQQK